MKMRSSKHNPEIGKPQRELFGGETQRHVSIDDMSKEELLDRLLRSAFTDAEWDSLDVDEQEHIYENDKESQGRVEELVKLFVSQAEHLSDSPAENDERSYMDEDIDNRISQKTGGDLIRLSSRRYREEISGVYEDHPRTDQDVVTEALEEALHDNNNWGRDYDISESNSGYMVMGSYTRSFYVPGDEIAKLTDEMFPDEIERAAKEINRAIYLRVDADEDLMRRGLGDHRTRTAHMNDFTQDDYETLYAGANPDWGAVRRAVNDSLGEEEDVAVEPKLDRPAEERIVKKWPDGFYALELLPSELNEEGTELKHCVKRPEYAEAVRRGRTKIISLRRPSGKPLLTFEVAPDNSKARQIFGKLNRVPGWDLNKIGEGKVKEDEVKRAAEVLETLGIDPNKSPHLRAGLQAIRGEEIDKTSPGMYLANPKRRVPVCPDCGGPATGFCAPPI